MNDSLKKIKEEGNPVHLSRLQLAVLLGTLCAFGPLSIDMYLPALPHIAKELHTMPSFVQLSLTFILIGLSLGQLIIGPLSDVRGRRHLLLIGLLVYFVASLLCAYSPSVWFLIGFRFIQGLSGAAGIVISRAIVRDLYSGKELTQFFSLLALVNGVAPILAPIFGGQLLRFAPWNGIFLVLSGIGFVMFLVVLFRLPETLDKDSRSVGGVSNTLKTFKKLFVDRSFIGYALSQGLVYASMFAYISGSPFVLQNIYGASPQLFSMMFAINGIGIILFSQITGRLAERLKVRRLFFAGLTLSFIGACALLLLLLLHAGLFFILIPLFFVVASVGIISTSGTSLAMQNQRKSAGSASALLGVLMFVLGGSASPLVGLGQNPAISMGIVIFLSSLGAVLSSLILAAKRP
ncbi:multidrug effflux MFS transporter [Pullulanibacillus sp. KACC 23026]|uniref:multidrug effflux MFS transporter n=1 Tax=Pullulanibacillus sp. KACC 23026 TaxID=3028315 RepID=UPI0023B080AA|nr:multidrug effflux MFS transporter [Pullulanibacillus sp. KACC 23026]WEG11041.1 multidrug effflux MFS transporter [Pullulanibacillus sp. KACC 23026]